MKLRLSSLYILLGINPKVAISVGETKIPNRITIKYAALAKYFGYMYFGVHIIMGEGRCFIALLTNLIKLSVT